MDEQHGVWATSETERPRVGVYVCHCGGNISDVVDVERVTEAAGKLPDVVVARNYMFMCSDPGQGLIAQDIREHGVNRVVVAACSPRLHELTFRRTLARAGLNPYLYEAVNIREQDSWAHAHDPEGATEKAIRLIAAGVAKARLARPLERIKVSAERRALVIGGGVAGLRAALDLAAKDIDVVLLEKSPFLGGRVAQLHTLFPTEDEARPLVTELAAQALRHPRIAVYTCAEVVGITGYIGEFQVKVREHPRGFTREVDNLAELIAACPQETENEFDYRLTRRKAIYKPYTGALPALPAIDFAICDKCGECKKLAPEAFDLEAEPREFELRVGVILVATGFDHYEPRQGEFAYGDLRQVITLPQLIRMLDPEGPTAGRLERDGQPVRRVVMIHCVGSRQIEGVHEPGPDGRVNDYCSRVCCTATLQAANEIRRRFPEVDVFEVYQDIRAYGRGHEEYYEEACKNGVTFLRYAGEEPPTVEPASDGEAFPVVVKLKDLLTYGEEVEIATDLVVLSVGVCPRDIGSIVDMLKLPVGADRFLLEVHPKLRPVETAIEGVLLAGSAQGPMDVTEACAAASAAAAKAAVILSGEYVELEPYVAEVDLSRCQGAGLCVEECAYDAITLEETTVNGRTVKRARVNAALCKGCGACVAVCPNRAIDLRGWTLEQYEAMVAALAADIPS